MNMVHHQVYLLQNPEMYQMLCVARIKAVRIQTMFAISNLQRFDVGTWPGLHQYFRHLRVIYIFGILTNLQINKCLHLKGVHVS